jgi:putative colanic acid biosynthesis UDP-glucose lipid carrier transferase
MKPIQLLDEGPQKTYYLKNIQAEFDNPSNALVKRAFDITLSAIAIIFILSWLLPILALIIKLDSRGPVLFVQKRIGINGKVFSCYKLRSMYVNLMANTKQATTNDRRITRFGKFLRISCLDELPQFFNVLKGEMSIVGPRPHMLKDCEDFANMVKNYNLRHQVKPGITGMAQVKGYRGETKDFYDIAHRYKWDIYYVKNNSFLLDLKIIHKTSVQTVAHVIRSSRRPKLSEHYVPAPAKEMKNVYSQLIES